MLFKIFCSWENFQQNFNPIKPHSLRRVDRNNFYISLLKYWFISVPDLTLNSLLVDQNAFETDLSNFLASKNVTITSKHLSQLIETNMEPRNITRGDCSQFLCNYSLFVFIEQLVRLLFNPKTVVCEENVTNFVVINSEQEQNLQDVLSELCR